MPHTQSRYQQDLGFSDGVVLFGPRQIIPSVAATGLPPTTETILTRNAAGDISYNQIASQAVLYDVNMGAGQLFRTGFGEDLQEQFGGAGIPASAQFQGRPDTIGAMAQLQEITPRTALKIKGIQINSIAVIELISGAALTAHTCRLDKTLFANNVAASITSIIASGANGLPTATQANPYVTEIPLAANQQIYRISDLSEYWLEIAATTQGGGTYRLYAVRMKVTFNFN